MTSRSTEPPTTFARQRYADLGVDTDAALRRLATVSISLHCWQGDDVGGFEEPDGKLGGGLAATGNYPGKARTPDELRRDAAKALSLIPGHASLQPARVLRRVRRPTRRSRCDRPGTLRRLDRLGEVARHRARLQPDLLLASEGGRQLHALASRQGHPLVLDPARGCLSPDRRRDGEGARHAVRDQRVDPRRHEGHAGRSGRPEGAADGIAGRGLRGGARPGLQPGCRRRQAVRARVRELHRRIARVLSRLRDVARRSSTRSTPATTIRPKPSPTRSARS